MMFFFLPARLRRQPPRSRTQNIPQRSDVRQPHRSRQPPHPDQQNPTHNSQRTLTPLPSSFPLPQLTHPQYSQSTLTSFTPQTWFYGCVYPFPYTAGSLPVDCTIKAQGYDSTGNAIPAAAQEFTFKANGSVVQDQNAGRFESDRFEGIYELGLSVAEALPVALVDNFVARVVQEECAVYYGGSY